MKKILSKREKVMQTALRMFAHGGFHASPMSELASVSGVAVGTIYHHFASKEDLILALHSSAKDRIAGALSTAAKGKFPLSKKTQEMFVLLHNHFTRDVLEFSFLDQFQSSPFSPPGKTMFDKQVMDVFREGVKEGKFKKLPAEVLAEFFYNTAAASARMQLFTQKKKISSKDIKTFAEMCWNGLKK
ncbi:MAG: TetR/AcrR family transcriptional regulator [Crocinitomicaceae bacterium]|nr:TetR/AcrR family transcriptional regulator [Crocinitomicaceae bacterium]